MKKKIIVAALLMSMAACTVFAEEQIVWEDQTAAEDLAFVFEEEAISEDTVDEQAASEEPEYVFEEPEIIEEQITDTDTVFEEIAFDEATEQLNQEPSVFEEQVTEDLVSEEVASEQTSAVDIPHAAEGLVYTGEPQELILPQPGDWTYSLDGETYTSELPTAINAGTYTVYLKEGDTDPVAITVCIAKADVIFTPPVANTTTATTSEAAPAVNEEPAEAGDEPAYTAVNEEPDEEVFTE